MEFMRFLFFAVSSSFRGGIAHFVEAVRAWMSQHNRDIQWVARMYLRVVRVLFALSFGFGVAGITVARLLAAGGYTEAANIGVLLFGIGAAACAAPLVYLLRVIPNVLAALEYMAVGTLETASQIAVAIQQAIGDGVDAQPPNPARAAALERYRGAIRFTEPALLIVLSLAGMYFGFFVSGMANSLEWMIGMLGAGFIAALLAMLSGGRIPRFVYTVGLVGVLLVMLVLFVVKTVDYRLGHAPKVPVAGVVISNMTAYNLHLTARIADSRGDIIVNSLPFTISSGALYRMEGLPRAGQVEVRSPETGVGARHLMWNATLDLRTGVEEDARTHQKNRLSQDFNGYIVWPFVEVGVSK